MFHLKWKPSPPRCTGRVTPGNDVDSSAMVTHARKVVADGPVELLQEIDRFEILAAAVSIRRPLAVLARVVEIDHRGDRVHAQAVDVILLDPEQRIRDQEIAHFVAAVVEDLRAPLRVLAAPRIGVLVQVRAVELGEPVRVAAESAPAPSP